MDSDHVDMLLAQWARQRPDLDCSPMGVLGRVARMAAIAGREVSEELKTCGLLGSDFDILATLRRAGEPLTPTALYQAAMLSSGAMTARLDKLAERGLIERQAQPAGLPDGVWARTGRSGRRATCGERAAFAGATDRG